MAMTKAKAIQLIGGKKGTQRKLAAALKIDESAISKWDDDKIPALREYDVKDIIRKRKDKAAKAKAKAK